MEDYSDPEFDSVDRLQPLKTMPDDGSLKARLNNILCKIALLPDPPIWDPVDFASGWYQAHLEFCDIFVTTMPPSPPSPEENAILMQTYCVAVNAIKAASAETMPTSDDEVEDSIVAHIDRARKLWHLVELLLLMHTEFGSPLGKNLFVRCTDRINVMLWALQTYRRSVALKPEDKLLRVAILETYGKDWRIKKNLQDYVVVPRIEESSTSSKTQDAAKKEASQSNEGGGRSEHRPGQGKFRKELKELYKCQLYQGTHEKNWCPVTQAWIPKASTVAAHIVPHSLSHAAERIFGPGTTLMDPRNGLYLHKDVETRFDNAQLIIVPEVKDLGYGGSGHIDRFKTILLDDNLRGKTYGGEASYEWDEIDGRVLDFQQGVTFRPAKRFLYFHVLFAAVRHSMDPSPGWASKFGALLRQESFASTGEYLTRGILLTVTSVIANNEVRRAVLDHIPDDSMADEGTASVVKGTSLEEASEDVLGFMITGYGLSDSSSDGEDSEP